MSDMFAVHWYEVGRCERCWALVQREDAEKHNEWHDEVDGWIRREQDDREEQSEYDE